MIVLGEGLGQIPRGTHDWDKFLTPEELTRGARRRPGWRSIDVTGLGWSPRAGSTSAATPASTIC